MCLASNNHENDWLIETNSFLIGELIFILNTDWMAKNQLDFSQSFL